MDESIAQQLKDLLEGVGNQIQSIASLVGQSPEGFNPTVWNIMRSLSETVVLPVGYLLLGLFFLIEIIALVSKSNSGGDVLMIEPMKVLFKVALMKFLLENVFKILLGIFGIFAEIIGQASGFMGAVDFSMANYATLLAEVNNYDMLVKILTMAQIFIVNLLIKMMGMIAWVVTVARMIELYLFTAVAPVPLSLMMSSETKSTGISFLKSYAAIALQGLLILLIIIIYGAVIQGATESGDLNSAMWQVLQWSLLLAFSVLQTSGWSKAILS